MSKQLRTSSILISEKLPMYKKKHQAACAYRLYSPELVTRENYQNVSHDPWHAAFWQYGLRKVAVLWHRPNFGFEGRHPVLETRILPVLTIYESKNRADYFFV